MVALPLRRRPNRIIHYYARFDVESSGVTESIKNWARATRDDVPTVVWHARAESHDVSGIGESIPHLGRGRSTWLPISLLWKLRSRDLVYLHEGWVLSNVAAAIAARLRGADVAVMPHGVYEPTIVGETRDLFGIRRAMEGLVLRSCRFVHVFYPSEAPLAEGVAGRELQSIALPNGAPRTDDVPRWDGTGDYFVWLGRFDVFHKGLDQLLAFWSRLSEPRPQLRLYGPDYLNGRRAVGEIVRTHGLSDQVVICDAVAEEEKFAVLRRARGYLHPSRWESCSITLLESLAVGTPTAVSSSIHAAPAMTQRSVVIPVDFTAERADADDVMKQLDRNVTLSCAAHEWADQQGGWDAVSRTFIELLGLREPARA